MSQTTRSALKAEDVARSSTRRSARLNKSQHPEGTVVVATEQPKVKRRKLAKELLPPGSTGGTACADEALATGVRRPCKTAAAAATTAPVDLALREKALLKKERELERRSEELDGLLASVAEKERHAALLVSQATQREARATLAQLEEHFTCALCYDIMACPISLNPGQCGHTFCALCILKWFFSRLHKACGGWHESVDCPICRSLLVITPDHSPRAETSFPFTPNRTVDTVVRDLVAKLADFPSFDVAGSKGAKGPKPTEEDAEMLAMAEWRTGGATRAEWLRRDLIGREEISEITKNWKNLNSKDFVDLKTKLGV